MIKTQTYQEIRSLRKLLPNYCQYLLENPSSFLTHYYGMYHVKVPHLGKNVPFVIMKSVFDTEKRIHKIWDLKGSTLGRKAKEGEVVYKDMDIIEEGAKLPVGPTKKSMIIEQLKKDAAFLSEMNVMDYSLLVGVHKRSVEREQRRSAFLSFDDSDGDIEVLERRSSPLDSDRQEKDSITPNMDNLREVASLFLLEATDGEYTEDDSFNSFDDASGCDIDGNYSAVFAPTEDSLCRFSHNDSCDDLKELNVTRCLSLEDSSMNVIEIADASDDRVEVLWVTSSNRISTRDDCGIDSWIVDTDTLQSKEIYYIGELVL